MEQKAKEKSLAIKLRKEGKTYNEILEVVPVAKSTLSLWLREVGLASKQKQRITKKKREAQLKGAARRHEMRLTQIEEINRVCKGDIGSVSERDLLLLGTALYWAEGSKQKAHAPSVGVSFANSDPEMIRLFMLWLRKIAKVKDDEMTITIHLHKNHIHRYEQVKDFWLSVTGLTEDVLTKPVIKKHNPKTVRKNASEEYQGLVSIYVRKSVVLNRKIFGWVYAIIAATK